MRKTRWRAGAFALSRSVVVPSWYDVKLRLGQTRAVAWGGKCASRSVPRTCFGLVTWSRIQAITVSGFLSGGKTGLKHCATSSSQCVGDEVLERIVGAGLRFPMRLHPEQGRLVTEDQPQEDLRDNAPADRSQSWCIDVNVLLNRNLHGVFVLRGFSEDVSPKRAITLENIRHGRDGTQRYFGSVQRLSDEDVTIGERTNSHGARDILP